MNQDVLTQEFEASRGQLKSYLLRMTASVEDTEDILQDTYIKASEKLATFKGDSSLKTWLFTIASNLAKDHLRARKRWPENVTDICKTAANEQAHCRLAIVFDADDAILQRCHERRVIYQNAELTVCAGCNHVIDFTREKFPGR